MRIVLACLAFVVSGSLLTASAGLAADPPPAGGTIYIQPLADGGYDPAMPAFVNAASEALTAKGFTVFDDPAHAGAVVELVLSRSDVGTGLAKARGQGASIIGTGVSVPLSTGASRVVSLQRTRLEMRIHRRGETGVAWNGAAVTVREAGVQNGTDDRVAADLTRALLQSYPVQPKEIVGVP